MNHAGGQAKEFPRSSPSAKVSSQGDQGCKGSGSPVKMGQCKHFSGCYKTSLTSVDVKGHAYQWWLYLHSGLKLAGMLSWQQGGYKSPNLSSNANFGKTKNGSSAALSG